MSSQGQKEDPSLSAYLLRRHLEKGKERHGTVAKGMGGRASPSGW